jgi:hypothetical protein
VAAVIAGGGTIDAYPTGAGRGSKRHIREPASLAEDDEGGPFVVHAKGWRGHHDVAEPVAVEIARGRDRKAAPGAVIAAREDDAESLGGSEELSINDRRAGDVLVPAAENHVGAVVGLPKRAQGNPWRAHDDVGKAITVDVAGGRYGRAGDLVVPRAQDPETERTGDGPEIKDGWNPSHDIPLLPSNTGVTDLVASQMEGPLLYAATGRIAPAADNLSFMELMSRRTTPLQRERDIRHHAGENPLGTFAQPPAKDVY